MKIIRTANYKKKAEGRTYCIECGNDFFSQDDAANTLNTTGEDFSDMVEKYRCPVCKYDYCGSCAREKNYWCDCEYPEMMATDFDNKFRMINVSTGQQMGSKGPPQDLRRGPKRKWGPDIDDNQIIDYFEDQF